MFFDIETTGLDYRVHKLISIQLKIGNNPPEIFASWESDEITIIEKLLVRFQSIQEFSICVGFNSLTFDIPFIVSRSVNLKALFPSEAFRIFYNKLAHTDLKHLLIPNNNWCFTGLSWDRVLEVYGFPPKKGSGKQVPLWFSQGEYDKIIDYVISEIEFMPNIYWMIRSGDLRTIS